MLRDIDLSVRMKNKEYKSEMKVLSERMTGLQQVIKEKGIPVMIVFEGWSSAGKGTYISKVLHPLDPRGYNVYTYGKVNEDIVMRPFLWNFWIKTPAKGRIAILDRSWHRTLLPESIEQRPLREMEITGFYNDVNAFERQLTEDGTLIIKFFLHISQSEQKERFDNLLDNPETEWRVDSTDISQNYNYEKYLDYYSDMIKQSNPEYSKWSIIEANDMNYATHKICKIIVEKIEAAIDAKNAESKEAAISTDNDEADSDTSDDTVSNGAKSKDNDAELNKIESTNNSILSSIDLNKALKNKDYRQQLTYYQEKLSRLGYLLYSKRRPVVIAYEGWDAAGKGGNIRRLTEYLDPRGYEVVPISAPTQSELSQHYLWRFWKAMPKDGHFTIFDRSWYGRVMVERIEGFCSEEEWKRAFDEINEMELHLNNHGTIMFKFWLHIDNDEQLRRFNDRQSNPLKQFKITDEDWRNREKWDEYETAVDEMLHRTSTPWAPWTVVESNDKQFARIRTLKLVADTLEQQLL
ncbi:MAG: phosphate--AMP phosphotransferase [Oscillospiraceae bacterium]|nr:phosphate--AMP phosphotransferase [Oscillospiraceae bacterium]